MAEVYDTSRFGELYYASRLPSVLSLGLAARYISSIFASHGIPFATIGGWAIFLRGSGRRTEDVDITVGTSMEHLKKILMRQPRIWFPETHGQTCVQVFIGTGRSYDDDYAQAGDVAVSMDIVISGNLGTPSNLTDACEQIIPRVTTPQGSPALVLNVFSQMTAKLAAFFSRGGHSDSDFRDLSFLIGAYGSQIAAFHDILEHAHRQAFVHMYTLKNPANRGAIDFVSKVLGVEA